jgi:hypothetical protein
MEPQHFTKVSLYISILLTSCLLKLPSQINLDELGFSFVNVADLGPHLQSGWEFLDVQQQPIHYSAEYLLLHQ